jgi:predicted RNA-binding Zn ribbon-like protein
MKNPLPFKCIGGHVAADFVNTVDWAAGGPLKERLVDAAAVAAWGVAAGVLTRAQGRELASVGNDPAVGARLLRRAHAVRRVLKELFDALGAGRAPGAATVAAFNAELRRAMAHVDFAAGRGPGEGTLRFTGEGEPGSLLFDTIVYAAAQLATSPEAARVRVCAAPDCGWVYVDRSRNGLRRWCQMETCGAKQKARDYYRRKREASARGS